MGWKSVKEHYRISHIVHVRKEGICIGSPYVSDLIVIALDGNITKRGDHRTNEDLTRYLAEMEADLVKLKELVSCPDSFAASIAVYTYEGAEIIEKKCETLGWPNVTHDGQLMYENTFSTDRAAIVKIAKENARLGVKAWQDNLDDSLDRTIKCLSELRDARAEIAKLEADNPSIP